MSFILDALNKAQREREEQREPVPQLSTVHPTPAPELAAKPKPVLGLLLVAAVAGLCLVAFVVGQWRSGGGTVATSGVDAPQPSERPQQVAESAQISTQPAEPEPVAGDVSSLYDVVRKQSIAARTTSEAEPSTGEGVDEAGAQQTQAARVAADPALTEAKPTTAQPETGPEPQPQQIKTAAAEKVAAEAQPQEAAKTADTAPAATLASRSDVPSLQALSGAVQQQLPSINYSRHDYHPEAISTVMINGATHRAGAQLGDGLVLEEILADGVILRFQSHRFKLAALNSWVNF